MQLSIILCNYNYGKYLDFALEGLTQQTQKPLELLIIDDASTDKSLSIIEHYAKKHSWIKTIVNPKNLGAYQSAQKGLSMAKGNFVYFACSDDRVSPFFVESFTKAYHQNPDAVLLSSEGDYFSQAPPIISTRKPSITLSFFSPKKVFSLKKNKFSIPGHTSVYRIDKVVEAGGVIEEIGPHCDWFFSHIIAYRYGMTYIPAKLGYKRMHKENLSQKQIKDIDLYKNLLILIQSKNLADIRPFLLSFRMLNEKREGILRASKDIHLNLLLKAKLIIRHLLGFLLKKFRK